MASLGELERAVMDLLWAGQEAATANTLRDLLALSTRAENGTAGRGQGPGVTTVLTVLSRLERKGLVERERGTRPHRYQAVSSREDHTAELMHEVLGSAPDREAVLARFMVPSPTPRQKRCASCWDSASDVLDLMVSGGPGDSAGLAGAYPAFPRPVAGPLAVHGDAAGRRSPSPAACP